MQSIIICVDTRFGVCIVYTYSVCLADDCVMVNCHKVRGCVHQYASLYIYKCRLYKELLLMASGTCTYYIIAVGNNYTPTCLLLRLTQYFQ